MALSFGLVSSILAAETASTHTLAFRPQAPPSRLRMVRAVTSATVSQSQPSTTKIRGIMKPRKVSPEMQALVGVPEISRTQALKLIWAYIKDNNLQDPENKRVIKCDETLKKVFAGRDQVGMLEIAGLISPHFLK
ncbi:upstream activation factor subunit UAF30 [Abrus precatorius]|uniref:Upstream activation factor subunit UAF30 n=1 Tax=Abrus precatorius TaxID=3816 RepID=A0A8B8M291_ABRPR|nr:upstream activation factor subunit UAF30 [Abrus precatorius]